jgi:hypothetical protein
MYDDRDEGLGRVVVKKSEARGIRMSPPTLENIGFREGAVDSP